jgi:pimeloyl-ACP methyl ester carboxylesterase
VRPIITSPIASPPFRSCLPERRVSPHIVEEDKRLFPRNDQILISDISITLPDGKILSGIKVAPVASEIALPMLYIPGACHGAGSFFSAMVEQAKLGHVGYAFNRMPDEYAPQDLRRLAVLERTFIDNLTMIAQAMPHERFGLVAHSLAAPIALKFLQSQDDESSRKVSHLILGAPMPDTGMVGVSWRAFLRSPGATLRSMLGDIYQIYRTEELVAKAFFSVPFVRAQPTTVCALSRSLGKESFPLFAANFAGYRLNGDALASSGVKVMVIAAKHDAVISPKPIQRMADRLGARYLELNDSGHDLFGDCEVGTVAKHMHSFVSPTKA